MPVKKLTSRAMHLLGRRLWIIAAGLAFAMAAPPALAQLAISQLVVELGPESRTADIEIVNDSDQRAYVVIEPREILDPGTAGKRAFVSPDPEKLGLLVSPHRMILEPRQRRRLRIAAIGPTSAVERVYRVTVKPVVGDVSGSETGLKLLVGYDLLVLARPAVARPEIVSSRNGRSLTLTNRGNSSAELVGGKQCDAAGENCRALPSKRLYAGASWQQILPLSTRVEYHVLSATDSAVINF